MLELTEDARRERRVALISCGAKKLDSAAAVRELYTSNLFRLSVSYAEQTCDAWYVASALHGLLTPDEEVAPYDRSLTDLRVSEREAWCSRVVSRLAAAEREHAPVHVVLLAGGHYRALAGTIRWTRVDGVNFCRGAFAGVSEPLEGLGIGQRLSWLKWQGAEVVRP